jgi:hypothetical protein
MFKIKLRIILKLIFLELLITLFLNCCHSKEDGINQYGTNQAEIFSLSYLFEIIHIHNLLLFIKIIFIMLFI